MLVTLDGKEEDVKFVYLYLDANMVFVKNRLLNAFAKMKTVGKELIVTYVSNNSTEFLLQIYLSTIFFKEGTKILYQN